MRFVASGPRQSPPRPTSAAPRPSAQLSNPPPSSASVSSTPQPRPQHPHARSSTRDCVTSDSRRSLESRVGVRRQQWASMTRTASPYNPQNTDPAPATLSHFSHINFDSLSRAHAGRRLMPRYVSSSLSLSLGSVTPGLITLAPQYLPRYLLLDMVWYLL
ncbi:hypothetical protein C8R46DRAFT_1058415 [Mycena filopes]|nr:hypothetical protein C8R46DRAFT_1058415 [Mycena filopes]